MNKGNIGYRKFNDILAMHIFFFHLNMQLRNLVEIFISCLFRRVCVFLFFMTILVCSYTKHERNEGINACN